MTDSAPIPPAPSCPRCGYDLSGSVVTWSVSCPITGVCSECGLSFRWRDVLLDNRLRLPWLYEYAAHWWSPRTALRTLAMLILPGLFWSRVRPHHPPVIRRLLLWPLFTTVVTSLLAFVLAAPVVALPAISYSFYWNGAFAWSLKMALARIFGAAFGWILPDAFYKALNIDDFGTPPFRYIAQPTLGFVLCATAVVLVCPSEWRRTHVRGAHLARMSLLSLAPVPIAACFGAAIMPVQCLLAVGWKSTNMPLIAFVIPPLRTYWLTPLPEWADIFNFVLVLLWQGFYWGYALRRGMELREPWFLWWMSMSIGFVGALIVPLTISMLYPL